MTWAVHLLGTISVAPLAVVTVLLWRLLHDLPTRRRLANLCLPLSQILCVVHAMALSGEYVYGAASAVLSSILGIACAICDPLLYRSLLQAERAPRARARRVPRVPGPAPGAPPRRGPRGEARVLRRP